MITTYKNVLLLTACKLFLVSTGAAQSTCILPQSGYADLTRNGTVASSNITPWASSVPSRTMLVYDATELPAKPIWISELAFMPGGARPASHSSGTISMDIDISMGALSPLAAVDQFDLNHGALRTRAFSGSVQFPAVAPSARADWVFRVPLSRPALAWNAAGMSLVVDVVTKSLRYDSGTSVWTMIEATEDRGSLAGQGNGHACHYFAFPWMQQSFAGELIVGGAFQWWGVPVPVGAPGLLLMGLKGHGEQWGSTWLPLNLSAIGAPRCYLDLEPLVMFPFVGDASGGAAVNGLKLPKAPALARMPVYFQAAYSAPSANALGWLFMPSLRVEVGSGEKCNAHTVWTNRMTGVHKWGSRFPGRALRIRLTY
jgi:hypothetical protein